MMIEEHPERKLLGGIPDGTSGIIKAQPKVMAQGRRCLSCDKTHVVFIEGRTVVHQWPLGEANPPQGVPDSVGAAFSEAVTCHHAHCPNAAVAMVRATLETIVRDKGETSKDAVLDRKIRNLHSRGLISQDLLDHLLTLKTLGNDGAHYNEALPVSDADASASLDLLRWLLFDLYEVPAKRDSLRSRRDMKPV